MTWFSSAAIAFEDRFSGLTPDVWVPWPSTSKLGTSIAGSWSWDSMPPASARESPQCPASCEREGVHLSAPREMLRRMASAARALGRSESDIWVEAAREWLLRHEPEGAAGRRANSGARETPAITFRARRMRAWREIDGVLDTLRDETRPAEPESVPA